ncbi:MAG: bifunctional diaminohydroxyphosphoribosylaminopyrimidine deaminase/5-amino-6-(5-phosphoribosylamino)uracil reductase RibD [Alphaproteobacteria bacterium]|nr:bifunctional diaminohydroxyphosphoribosylaminopyrimidine deaminase/5-amino-6-(5-phosphoribosylamino)uracil reductase RibD [Alphaproteobacteria bacterium]
MSAALALARRALGTTWPNPAVGCILTRDARVVGRGWTQPGGRPHAETEALRRAGEAARGATAFVSLEPCSHHGKTPPCAEALIEAGVARVVTAAVDPDPRVSGRGLEMLRAAGIAVDFGLLGEEATRLNAGFFLKVRDARPLVTLKIATSLDGRIATHRGESRWITGEASRIRAHAMRAAHDAILVGSGTVIADDPMLDVRLPGYETARRVRIVVDGRLRVPLTARIVRTASDHPTWFVVRSDVDPARAKVLADCGIELIYLPVDAETGQLSPDGVLKALGARGLTRVLLEGGARLSGAFLRAGLIDRLVRFSAGIALGGDGIPALAAFGVDRLADAPRFSLLESSICGEDALETWGRCP